MRPRIVVLGGGTGTFTVLSGLKQHHGSVDLAAIVSMADNGGSSGVLRDEYGVLPPGDILQALVALAENPAMMRGAFTVRFKKGPLEGHTNGNVFLSGLLVEHDPFTAIDMAHDVFRVEGRVIPVSACAANLIAKLEDGTTVNGEHQIDKPAGARSPIERCVLSPEVEANPAALRAIRYADLIVIGPGDLYTSLVPILLVKGIAEALAQARAKRAFVAFVLNLTSKQGQTEGYTARRFLKALEAHMAPALVDTVLVNSAPMTENLRELVHHYQSSGEPLVEDDFGNDSRVVRCPLLADDVARPVPGDPLRRSLLRHDPSKLAAALLQLLA